MAPAEKGELGQGHCCLGVSPWLLSNLRPNVGARVFSSGRAGALKFRTCGALCPSPSTGAPLVVL